MVQNAWEIRGGGGGSMKKKTAQERTGNTRYNVHRGEMTGNAS